jgi:hypothetical protein
LGYFDDALVAFDVALELDPNHAPTWNIRAIF